MSNAWQRFAAVALIFAGVLGLAPEASAQDKRVALSTNQSYIEEAQRRSSLPLADTRAMFSIVLAGLPPGQPVRLNGDFTGPGRIAADGKLTLAAAPGRRRLEVRW